MLKKYKSNFESIELDRMKDIILGLEKENVKLKEIQNTVSEYQFKKIENENGVFEGVERNGKF